MEYPLRRCRCERYPGGWNQGSVADAQAGLQEAPVDNRQIILVKIVGSSGDATVMVSLDDLVMDVAGCTYEPADKDAPLIISKNVSIVADNIILTDAVIGGSLQARIMLSCGILMCKGLFISIRF